MRHLIIASTLLLLIVCAASSANADSYLRVIAQRAPVHSGPGPNYREVYYADRGQVFTVLERGTRDYWFKVELDDGTSGWILGDMVFPFEVGEDKDAGVFRRMGRAIRKAILGPSPAPYADVGLSFSAGILDKEGKKFEFEMLSREMPPTMPVMQHLLQMQQNLKKLGIKMEIRKLEWTAFLDKVDKGDFDVCRLAWALSSPPPALTSRCASTRSDTRSG